MPERIRLTIAEAEALALAACRAAGAGEDAARSLTEATLSAHRHGRPEVGFAHLLDYLSAFRAGRIRSEAKPRIERVHPAFFQGDADGGLAQLGFDRVFPDLVSAGKTLGIAVFTQRNSFTTGELGHYVRRLAEEGLIGIAFTNANAFMAPAPGKPKVFSTNPIAFAYPLGEGRRSVVIDQSSSATAFVNIATAARKGEALDPGIAVNAAGAPTTDAAEAIRGALLPFGGRKGANIALMVELMAAGLSGAAWSKDMPDFQHGDVPLDAGLTVIALSPGMAPDAAAARGAEFVESLKAGAIHVPGTAERQPEDHILLEPNLVAAIRATL